MSAKPLKDGTIRPSVFNSILMEPTIIAHVCKYSISFLSMQMKNGVNTRQLYALPPGRRRAAAALAARQPTLPRPHHPESGQARVHSSERPLASLERPLRLQSRQLGSSPWAPSPPRGLPLLLPRAGETVAAEAVHRLARPHAQQVCPRRPSVPDRRPANAQMPGQAGQKGEAVKRLCQLPPEASTVTDSCRFNPSQPPKGGAINARALSSLRITVGAKNPRHNITQHCITPRGSGGSQNRP